MKVLELVKDADGDALAAKVYFVDTGRRPRKEIPRDNLIVLPDCFATVPYQVNFCK